jgi:hypothetical protein
MLAVMLIAAAVQALAVREVVLDKPERVHTQDFTQIRGVRELRDGRVLLSDRTDQGIVVLDFASNRVQRVGRSGRGPEEYRLPTQLAAIAGDSTLVSDEGNQRLVVIGPDLRIHRAFTLAIPGVGTTMTARAMDRHGRYYLQIPAWMSQRETPNDTIPVVRFDAPTRKLDTLARVRGTNWLPPGPRYGFGWVVFGPVDNWAVGLDGRVAIVRSGDYHVEWLEPNGRVVRGAPVRTERIPVTMAERLAYVRAFLENSVVSGRGADGGMSPIPAEMRTAERMREMATRNTFAEFKPPFTDAALHIAPDGTLWVERSVKVGDPARWDVFDTAARHIARVTLHAGRTLGGLGRQALYLVATDEDGVQRLERYALPRLTR